MIRQLLHKKKQYVINEIIYFIHSSRIKFISETLDFNSNRSKSFYVIIRKNHQEYLNDVDAPY